MNPLTIRRLARMCNRGPSPDREQARRELLNAELATARAKVRATIAAKVIRGFFEPKGGRV